MPGSDTYCRSSPVLVPAQPNWTMDYAGVTVNQLVGLSDEQLATVDPLAANLIVAREIPSLADLDLAYYQDKVNAWTADFATRYLPYWEQSFQREPHCYLNDYRFFAVGMICQYLGVEIGAKYIEEQRGLRDIHYTDPSSLFLHGLIDSLRGTCGNMPTLALAIGWRMGWPVSLACVRSHHFLRYDDGETTFNFEAAVSMERGFSAPPDCHYVDHFHLPRQALRCGSDVRALTPRERLSVFIGLRARHFQDLGHAEKNPELIAQAEQDYLLARWLFPAHRLQSRQQAFLSAYLTEDRFHPGEIGHWQSYAALVDEVRDYRDGSHECLRRYGHRRPERAAFEEALEESGEPIIVRGF